MVCEQLVRIGEQTIPRRDVNQGLMKNARNEGKVPICTCTEEGVPMHFAKIHGTDRLTIRRNPGTAERHAYSCASRDVSLRSRVEPATVMIGFPLPKETQPTVQPNLASKQDAISYPPHGSTVAVYFPFRGASETLIFSISPSISIGSAQCGQLISTGTQHAVKFASHRPTFVVSGSIWVTSTAVRSSNLPTIPNQSDATPLSPALNKDRRIGSFRPVRWIVRMFCDTPPENRSVLTPFGAGAYHYPSVPEMIYLCCAISYLWTVTIR